MTDVSLLIALGRYLLIILFPFIAFYIGYLVVTKAFQDMGFTSLEAIIIVFVSFLTGSGILDGAIGLPLSNIPLFHYGEYWMVGINMGGAIIPILLSIYLIYKNKLTPWKLVVGIAIVAVITYLVTEPVPERGIISPFPFWLLPVMFSSFTSLILWYKAQRKAAPFAYTIGTLGVLIGADVFHLIELLQFDIGKATPAVIGGANIFDMVFLTGILAVILDGVFTFKEKKQVPVDR